MAKQSVRYLNRVDPGVSSRNYNPKQSQENESSIPELGVVFGRVSGRILIGAGYSNISQKTPFTGVNVNLGSSVLCSVKAEIWYSFLKQEWDASVKIDSLL